MRRAAVIGAPVSHSRSPAIFSFIASRLGLTDFNYSAREVLPSGLPIFLNEVRTQIEWVGLNVTIPHKEAVLSHLDTLAPEARAIGAVNVVRAENGKLHGHNTDVIGVMRTLESHPLHPLEDALILGAGGAARAVTYALGKMGARRVHLHNRSTERAQSVAHAMSSVFPKTQFLVNESPQAPLSLVVNSTPLGMTGVPAETDSFTMLASLPIKQEALAFDLIYNPEQTPFLSLAQKRGMRTAGGLRMLIDQALATWEIWFGPSNEALQLGDALTDHIRSLLKEDSPTEDRPIFLTGLMGVGKSTVGYVLARKLGWRFVDTDRMIVERAGMPISAIFQKKGEAFFREVEAVVVKEAAGMKKAIIALGGGALMNPESLETIQNSGHLVHLRASLSSLQQRLRATAQQRPLLAGLDPEQRNEKLRALFEARRPVYDRAPHQVETDGASPDDIAEEVRVLIFRRGKK